MQATNELWGRQAGPNGIGGANPAARAYDGPHDPSRLKPGVKLGVEFVSQVPPTRSAIWFGAKTVIWEDGAPGTTTVQMGGKDTVIVPISVKGVF